MPTEGGGGGRALPWLARLGQAVARRPWRVLLAAAGLCVVALAGASRLELETDLLAVVSDRDPAVRAFLETTERFGSLDRLLVVLHLPVEPERPGVTAAGADPGREVYLELADRLAAGLAALPQVERVDHRLPALGDLARELMPWALLLVPSEDLDEVEERLSRQGLAAAAAATRRRLAAPQSILARSRLQADPFDLLPLVARRFGSAGSSGPVDPASGYFISPDGRLLLLDVQAVRPAHDVPFARDLVAAVEAVAEREVAALRDELPAGSRDGFRPRPALAGGYALAAADVDRVQADLARNTTFALVAVGTLFLLAFRRPAAFGLALVPLIVGLVLTAGVAGLTVGRLSSLTSSVTALLVGLGVDFTLVLLERYGEERRRGRGPAEAAGVMLGSTGRGVAVGALTTAATFLSFLVCGFRGLFELGWLVGAGILLCLAATFLLLPALLALAERRGGGAETGLRMRSFGSPRLVRLARRRPGATVAAWTLLLGLLALGLPRLSFEDHLGALRSEDHPVQRTQAEITHAFGLAASRMVLRLDGGDPVELLERARRLRTGLEPLLADGTLASVLSLPDLLPPRPEQERVLAVLETGRDGTGTGERDGSEGFSPARVAVDARQALRAAGLAPAAFEPALRGLEQALDPPGVLDAETVLRATAGTALEPWLDRLLVRTADGWSTALYLVPPPDAWTSRPPPGVERLAAGVGADLVGLNTVSEAMRRQAWRDLERAAPLALALVWLLLVADFRSVRLGTLSLLPVAPGLLALLGLAGWLGLPLSLMNLFVVVLVLGVGVDYGVHLVHRQREARSAAAGALPEAVEAELDAGLGETSKAVLLASLTTAFGFGSLALSGFAGLRSVGWLAVFGAVGSGLAALTLLPALLALGRPGRRGRRGG